jgi:hypothetical protein
VLQALLDRLAALPRSTMRRRGARRRLCRRRCSSQGDAGVGFDRHPERLSFQLARQCARQVRPQLAPAHRSRQAHRRRLELQTRTRRSPEGLVSRLRGEAREGEPVHAVEAIRNGGEEPGLFTSGQYFQKTLKRHDRWNSVLGRKRDRNGLATKMVVT